MRKVENRRVNPRTALITGITGQDGSYLAEHLLDLGYRVVGVTRRTSSHAGGRVEHLGDRIELFGADLLDQTSLLAIVDQVQPDEVYNLAAQSFVTTSWQQPVLTGEVTALGVKRLRLFGSIARGERGPESDVDLLAEIDHSFRFSLIDLVGLQQDLEDLIGRKVEIATAAEEMRQRIRARVEADAIEIF